MLDHKSEIVSVRSKFSVDETVGRVEQALTARAIKLFMIVDHSGEAETAGIQMPPTKLLVFGNPKAGTPLMLASPTAALDLPLKLLVAQDAAGQCWIRYNSAAFLQQRHGFPPELLQNVLGIEKIAAHAAGLDS